MKVLFNNYLTAEKRANEADSAWEANPENEELEKAFDEAYKAEHEALEALIEEIEKETNGEIDKKTARMLVTARKEEVKSLIERIA